MRERPIMPGRARRVTAEEFARILDDDHRYELVEGRLVRMTPPGSRHAVVATRIAMLLQQYADARRLGVVMTSGGFRIRTSPDTVREPDVAFVSRDRIPASGVPDGFWQGPPDLAVEIVSPTDRRLAVAAKANEYLARGVRLVWVVEPSRGEVTVYQPGAPPTTLGAEDVLDAGDVIPGFTCAAQRFFE